MIHVQLFKRKRKGRATAWMLRHFDPATGKPVSESLGSVDAITAKDAKDRRAAKEADLNAGKIPSGKPGRKTLADFAAEYADRRRQGDTGRGYLRGSPRLDEATITEHAMTLRYMRQHFGDARDIGTITVSDAEGFIEALAAGKLAAARKAIKRTYTVGPQTIRKNIRNAKAVYNWAQRFGYVNANPFDDFDGRPLASEPNAYVPVKSIEAVVKACPSHGWKALFGLCRFAGLRLGEAVSLAIAGEAVDRDGVKRWVGIDWNRRRIHLVAEKTDCYRVVPMTPRLHDILADAFAALADGSTRIVDVAPNNLTREGKAIVKAAGVKPWAKLFQSLRSSCENDWKAEGVAEATYAAFMGHSANVSRKHYTSPTDGEYAQVTRLRLVG